MTEDRYRRELLLDALWDKYLNRDEQALKTICDLIRRMERKERNG